MNKCEHYLENMSAYIDKELPETDRKAFVKHLGECQVCSDELELMKTILGAISGLEEELPDGFEASLRMRLEMAKKDADSKKRSIGKIKMFTQIAAGFVLVIALGLIVRTGIVKPKLSGSAASPEMATTEAAPRADAAQAGMGADKASDSSATEPTYEIFGLKAVEPGVTSERANGAEGFNMDADKFLMQFSEEDTSTHMTAGQDTCIRLAVEDVNKAIDTIMAIEERLGADEPENLENLKSLKDVYNRSADQPVEVKLVFSNDELWQDFLSKMQNAFPTLEIESVPAQEEQEYIRIFIEVVR